MIAESPFSALEIAHTNNGSGDFPMFPGPEPMVRYDPNVEFRAIRPRLSNDPSNLDTTDVRSMLPTVSEQYSVPFTGMADQCPEQQISPTALRGASPSTASSQAEGSKQRSDRSPSRVED